MNVELIAHTMLEPEIFKYDEPKSHALSAEFGDVVSYLGYSIEKWMGEDEEATNADTLAEFAGRACYQSFHKPNPKTQENADYLANILAQGHESVLEHASATFYVTGVSRALTHELIRHRHLSFSELSQRFVDVKDTFPVFPPAIESGEAEEWVKLSHAYQGAQYDYGELVDILKERGLPRKQAREAARAVMPNATETRIVVTGNLRAWLDVLRKRWHVAADAELQQFAGEVLAHLRSIAPNTVQNVPSTPYGSDG